MPCEMQRTYTCCPSVTVRHQVQPLTSWSDVERRTARRRVRDAERRYTRTWLDTDRRQWTAKCNEFRELYEQHKMLSYHRETALHGALVLDKSGRLKLGDNIYEHHCHIIGLQSYRIRRKNAK